MDCPAALCAPRLPPLVQLSKPPEILLSVLMAVIAPTPTCALLHAQTSRTLWSLVNNHNSLVGQLSDSWGEGKL